MWDWELSSGRVRHNAQWARLMGLDERQLEHTWQEALACLHEQEREGVMARSRTAWPVKPPSSMSIAFGVRMAA